MSTRSAVEEAIRRAGSRKGLASDLGITPQAITRYLRDKVPAERAVEIEKLTGVSRELLRPDIFGK